MDALLGGMPDAARFIFAFVVVLGLIIAGAFLWRRFGTGSLATIGPRGRQPRLAVIDAASIDARRRLVLVRRDNTEHLLMIGGPTDLVIEPNIPRAANSAARELRGGLADPRQPTPLDAPGFAPGYEPALRAARGAESTLFAAESADSGWGEAGEQPSPVVPPMAAEAAPRSGRIEASLRVSPPLSSERLVQSSAIADAVAAMPPETPVPPVRMPAFPEPRRASATPPLPEPMGSGEPRRILAAPPPLPEPMGTGEPRRILAAPPPLPESMGIGEPRRIVATPPPLPESQAAPEPRRIVATPPPLPESQPAPEPRRIVAAPPPLPEPGLHAVSEPRRTAAPAMPPPAAAYEPVFHTEPPPEPRRATFSRVTPRAPVTPEGMPEPDTQWVPPLKAAAPPEPTPRSPMFQSSLTARRSEALAPAAAQSDDSNLSEMATRLEAALRRPTRPVESLSASQSPAANQARQAARPDLVARATRAAAQFDPAPPPAPMPQGRLSEPGPAPRDAAASDREAQPAPFESLEEEMASLLSRPPGKT